MCAGDDVRPFRDAGDFIDVERGGVGEQQGAGLHHRVELAEDGLLGSHFLKDGLNGDVGVGEIGIIQHRGDAGETVFHFILRQTATFDRGFVIGADAGHAAI